MSNVTNKLFVDKMGGNDAIEYVGVSGDIFYDPSVGALRLSDGSIPGGTTISLERIDSLVQAAYENYQDAINNWSTGFQMEASRPGVTVEGWPWLRWKVTGENYAYYLDELNRAWSVQNAPSSPPSPLVFTPAISAALYQQMRAVLLYISGAYELYLNALEAKKISGSSLTIPEILQTVVDEDLVISIRYSIPSSPPGSSSGGTTNVITKNFTFKTNGTIVFPDSTIQTSAAISRAELKSIVASSADFAAFKSAIASL